MRKSKSVLAGFAAVVFSFVLVASVAPKKTSALSTYVWDNRRTVAVVPLRFQPTTKSNVKLWIIEGTKFRMHCYIDHQDFTGNYRSRRWFRGQEFSRGSVGYIHSSYVINQERVPRC